MKAISGTISNEKYKIDLCCRSLYKCDAHKHIELNQTTEIHISYCGCVKLFKTCLKNLNTSLSNEVSFIHAINTTKCFSKVHPIIKCIELEEYSDEIVKLFKFTNLNERAKYFRRCVKYELDQDEKEELQIFDMPFNDDIGRIFKKKQNYVLLFSFLCTLFTKKFCFHFTFGEMISLSLSNALNVRSISFHSPLYVSLLLFIVI